MVRRDSSVLFTLDVSELAEGDSADEHKHAPWQREATHDEDQARADEIEQGFTSCSSALSREDATPMIDSDALLSDDDFKSPRLRSEAPPIGACGLVLMNSVWFASSFCWFLLLIVIVPSQVALLVGEGRKGSSIGAVLGCSTPVALVGAPLVGILSDRVRSTHGRRRPLMIPGAIAFCVVLIGLVTLPRSLWEYGALYTALRSAELLISAPFNGLIADLTPVELRGLASGIMGAAGNLGNFAGAAVGVQYTAIGPSTTAVGMSLVMLTCMAATCVTSVEEDTSMQPPPPPLRPLRLLSDLVSPLRNHDFAWVFATRLIFQMGVYTVQEFLEYYFRDAVQLPAETSPETAVSYGMLCLMTSAVLTAAAGGVLTDVLGGRRKILVYLAGGTMSAVCIAVVFMPRDMLTTLLLLTVFGLGYGCYLAVDFAMVLDVLPHPDDAAKDMAVWSIALTLPQMLATPTGGVMLDEFQRIGKLSDPQSVLGYKLVFALAAFYLLLSTVLVSRIKGVK